ncbi:aldose epimerase [Roseomonas xinghualingensis]|uniref:aldose epimerase family protein n=1 Tax=Roseomonas xinghualingensis TaxID=2986475 RepID=UPI0021F1D909|nr:aldose epimerase [Roseomonas sp. SXEYE001]MCV4206414.1 aldose epimerase [Roseomonas sp. SXEYE001]
MMEIAGGDWRAALLPERGGALAMLSHDGEDVLLPLPPGADPNDYWAGAFLMLPWSNRLDEGRLPYPGGIHHFPCNRVAERTALHGISREHAWRVESMAPDRAVLVQEMDAAPYRYTAWMEVALGEDFSLTLSVTNRGEAGMPFGTGWHPFFVRPAGTSLSFHATGTLARDDRNLPVQTVPSDGVSGGEDAYSGLDTHYTGWDGVARLTLGAAAFTLCGEDAWSRNLQVFTPHGAPVICVEPVSHVPDVVNRGRFAPLGDMRHLACGEAITGRVRLRPVP